MDTISLREAAAFYGIPPSTLSGWVKAGLIRVLKRPERRGQPSLLYEPDVLKAARQYKPGRSRWERPTPTP